LNVSNEKVTTYNIQKSGLVIYIIKTDYASSPAAAESPLDAPCLSI